MYDSVGNLCGDFVKRLLIMAFFYKFQDTGIILIPRFKEISNDRDKNTGPTKVKSAAAVEELKHTKPGR